MRGRVHCNRRTDQDLRVSGVLRDAAVQRVQRFRDALVGGGRGLFSGYLFTPRQDGRRRSNPMPLCRRSFFFNFAAFALSRTVLHSHAATDGRNRSAVPLPHYHNTNSALQYCTAYMNMTRVFFNIYPIRILLMAHRVGLLKACIESILCCRVFNYNTILESIENLVLRSFL